MKEELQHLVLTFENITYRNKIYLKLFLAWLVIIIASISLTIFINAEIKKCYPPHCTQPLIVYLDDLNLFIMIFLPLPLLVIIIILVIKLEQIKKY